MNARPRTRALVLILVFLLNLDGIVGFNHLDQLVLVLLFGLILLLREHVLLHAALVFLLMSLNTLFADTVLAKIPVAPILMPLVLSTLLLLPSRSARETMSWFARGVVDRWSWIVLFATAILSAAALILWASWTDSLGISVRMTEGFSNVSLVLILAAGVPAFALANAFAEEMVYRGILQEALTRVLRAPLLVLPLQAAAFAAIHFAVGFPNGAMGYAMVFVYGTVLGYLRIRTQGMLAPYLAHVMADLTIGYYLFFRVIL